MQKKIVAAICAVALALAMPVAAFAANSGAADSVNGSIATWTVDKVKGDNGSLSNFTAVANSTWFMGASVTPANGQTAISLGGDNILLTQSFNYEMVKGATNTGKGYLGKADQATSIKFDIDFSAEKVADFLGTVGQDNLYTTWVIKHEDGSIEWGPSVKGTSCQVTTDRCSVVTAVLTNGKYVYGVSGTNSTSDLENSSKDSSKSPKTGEVAA